MRYSYIVYSMYNKDIEGKRRIWMLYMYEYVFILSFVYFILKYTVWER